MFRALFLTAFLLAASLANAATMVEIRMPIGTVTLELYDEDKPITVSNFLSYIESGRYENSFAHRLDPGFVIQGGGFTLDDNTIKGVPTFDAIKNEYSSGATYSNLYGTIAMARVGGKVDSATSQWFINLGDNAFLDTVDEGFTVFGKVISGFEVLERLNTTFDDDDFDVDLVGDASGSLGGAFGELPLLFRALHPDALLYTEIVIVPEPATFTLGFLGLTTVAILARRRRYSR